MATRQAHAPAESGEASATRKILPTSSAKLGEILAGIIFIPSGGNVGALPTGLSGDGGEGFGVTSDPSPVHNDPPPSPTPQPQTPQTQPQEPSPQAPQPTRNNPPSTHDQPSLPKPTSPTNNPPSNDRPSMSISSDGIIAASGGAGAATNIPLPTSLGGDFPQSPSPSRTAIPVSSCDGTDACITVSGKTFSFIPTGIPSSTSLDSLGDGMGPSFSVLYPSVAPKGLDVIQDNPFHADTLKIISICTLGYFFVAIASTVGFWIIARHRGRKRSLEYV